MANVVLLLAAGQPMQTADSPGQRVRADQGSAPAGLQARATRNGLPLETYGLAERRQRPRYA